MRRVNGLLKTLVLRARRAVFLLVPLAALCTCCCAAQGLLYGTIYRPAGTRYYVLRSPHFDVIFEDGLELEARAAASVLEAALPETARLVGMNRRLRMLVVLNGYNDRGNGYVTALPFKQEIEVAGVKGSRLTSRFPSWLDLVGPHELTHAVQANAGSGFGVGAVLRFFAPDAARLLNLTAPSGMSEGVAVYNESRQFPGAGRLHSALSTMEFRAAMRSDAPWTLSRVLEPPAYTYPFDRHYNGGGRLVAYLAEQDSGRFFRRATDFYYRFPFLGYGAALWYGAASSPAAISRRFLEDARRRESARIAQLGALTEARVLAAEKGVWHRRPLWESDSTLIVHVEGYSRTPGFYRFHVATGRRERVAHHRTTEDYVYNLDHDSLGLVFARYVRGPLVTRKATSEAFRLDLTSGRAERLTHGGRVFAPVPAPGSGTWAIQHDGQYTRWVLISPRGDVHVVADLGRADLKSVAPSPDGGTIAVLVNEGGRQGIYRAPSGGGRRRSVEPWVVFQNATVFDVSWSPDGRYLVFSADVDGVINIYAFEVNGEKLVRLTNAPYGALEPSISPDGQRLAFIAYRDQQYDLMVRPFAPDDGEPVALAAPAGGRDLSDVTSPQAELPDSIAEEPPRPYHPLTYLKPRMLYPILDGGDARTTERPADFAVGVGLQGVDPLQQWAYGAEVFRQRQQVWGEAGLQWGGHFLRPSVSLYRLPILTANGSLGGEDFTWYEDRGISLGTTTPVILASDVYTSSAQVGTRLRLRQVRRLDELDTQAPQNVQLTFSPSVAFGYRLQRNARDLLPNSGVSATLTGDMDLLAGHRPLRGHFLISRVFVYLPFLKEINHSIRIDAGLLARNEAALRDYTLFLPRGHESAYLTGTYLRYGAEYVAPIKYVDSGRVLIPIYLKALYGFSFAETLHPITAWSGSRRLSSAGLGIGAQLRLFFNVEFDVRLAISYKLEERAWDFVAR